MDKRKVNIVKEEMIQTLEADGWICGEGYTMTNQKYPGKWYYWPHFTLEDFRKLGYELKSTEV
jgi:hypothetical protein